MSQSIDFLPDSYRQQLQHRKKKVWHLCVIAMFLGLFAFGWVGQIRLEKELARKADWWETNVRNKYAKLADAQKMRQRDQQLDSEVNLLALLRMSVPTSRLHASVTNSLPKYVRLIELRTNIETTKSKSRRQSRRDDKATQESTKLPVQHDAENLIESANNSDIYVWINGIAPDDITISHFLRSLEQSKTFIDVKLLTTEQYTFIERQLRSFEIELRVTRPSSVLDSRKRDSTKTLVNRSQRPSISADDTQIN